MWALSFQISGMFSFSTLMQLYGREHSHDSLQLNRICLSFRNTCSHFRFFGEFFLSNSLLCCLALSLCLCCLFIRIAPLLEYQLATLCSSWYSTNVNSQTVMGDNSLYVQVNSNLLYIMQF